MGDHVSGRRSFLSIRVCGMQSARRPLTRDASGPGFRPVEPHRFRSAAQPTDPHQSAVAVYRGSVCARGALSKSVPVSRHRETHKPPPRARHLSGFDLSRWDNWLEWFSLLLREQRRLVCVVPCRSPIEHLMYGARNEVTRDFRANLHRGHQTIWLPGNWSANKSPRLGTRYSLRDVRLVIALGNTRCPSSHGTEWEGGWYRGLRQKWKVKFFSFSEDSLLFFFFFFFLSLFLFERIDFERVLPVCLNWNGNRGDT